MISSRRILFIALHTLLVLHYSFILPVDMVNPHRDRHKHNNFSR
jgi:hypothetical protein